MYNFLVVTYLSSVEGYLDIGLNSNKQDGMLVDHQCESLDPPSFIHYKLIYFHVMQTCSSIVLGILLCHLHHECC